VPGHPWHLEKRIMARHSKRKRRLSTQAPSAQTTPTAAASPPQEREEQGYRPSSRRRAVLFRLVAASLPLMLLAAGNLILYCFDIGTDTRVIIPVSEAGDDQTFCFNEHASQAYFDIRELAGPDPQPFQLPATAGTYRVVVVGASTVEGFPFYTELAFPRQVEIFLRRQLRDRQFEVLNAGVVGLNSFALADFVPRLLACEPDLVVVYAGHNEFYGPGGVGSTATISPTLYPSMTHLRRWRLFQWLRKNLRREQPKKMLVESLPRTLEIRYGDEQFRTAEEYYRQHLIDMAEATTRPGIPILMCSVVCNLSDQSPVHSIFKNGLEKQRKAELQKKLALAQAQLAEGETDSALKSVEEAAEIDDSYALVAYRRAQCLAAANKNQEALAQFELARDLDGCRFRAPGSFRNIVREVATSTDRKACFYLDLQPILVELSSKAAPGHDYFLEHVHLTFDGHCEVARAISRTIVQQVLGRTWEDEQDPSNEQMAQAVGLTTYDQIEAVAAALTILSNMPFKEAPDRDLQSQFLKTQFNNSVGSLAPQDQVMFAEINPQLRRMDMINVLASELIKRGNVQQALMMFRCAQLRRPWEITPYIGVAQCLMALGQRDEAIKSVEHALELAPRNTDLLQIHRELARQGK
jgi:Tfp pilus assembly protein PilF/lysophospholipase L1-like esterase